jgi:hypothetical protein
MDAKLRIDITQGILEVEGSEKLVNEIYRDFKENISRNLHIDGLERPSQQTPASKFEKEGGSVVKKKRRIATGIKLPSLATSLDLLGKGKGKSLKEFIDPFLTPKSAMEWNLLFVYFLQKILETPAIGIDQIYTCYKHLNVKPPTNLYQSIIDTAHRKGSINTDSLDSISITMVGENLVDHEMPRKVKANGNTI